MGTLTKKTHGQPGPAVKPSQQHAEGRAPTAERGPDPQRLVPLVTVEQNHPGRIRRLHAAPAQRVEELIRRGRDGGAFRADLPIAWLVSVVHHVLKGAAEENCAERLKAEDAARVVIATVQSLLSPPDRASTDRGGANL